MPHTNNCLRMLIHCLMLLPGWILAAEPPLPEQIEFNRDVRPILSENCYVCHGPDKDKRAAELRLDTQSGLLGENGKGGPVIARDLAQSELYRRITTTNVDEVMPRPESGKRLSPRDVAVIRRWIEQGAAWQGHWSYIPPAPRQAPEVSLPGFVRNDVDRFILARLQSAGLKPSPEAHRATLIRRLSFDLTGLPPQPEEVDAFVNDNSADAYEKLVDRLLVSPHFGERMAQYWLDLVRFADTIGYHSDNPRDITPYRDYVIDAFNQNLPFDRFTIEQIAGDLLPAPTIAQRVASGYNRLLQTTEEGGAQPKEYTAKYAADRVRNLSSVWLGATMGCAECHDHKFDPFTTRDFYALAAFFADIKESAVGRREPGMPVPTAEQIAEQSRLEKRIGSLRGKLESGNPELMAAQRAWEVELLALAPFDWQPLKPGKIAAARGTTFQVAADQVIVASGGNPADETVTIEFTTNLREISALRIEAIADKSLPKGGPGRNANGKFVLSGIDVQVADPLGENQPVDITAASASGATSDVELVLGKDKQGNTKADPKRGWTNGTTVGRDMVAIFEIGERPMSGNETRLTITLRQTAGELMTLGRFRISASTAKRPVRINPREELPANLAEVLTLAADKRTPQQARALGDYFAAITPLLKPVREELARLEKAATDLQNAMPRSLVAVTDKPRMVRMLPRGNWLDDSGEPVEPAVPAFLASLAAPRESLASQSAPPRRASRLDLASWIVSPDNPLTVRVFVNRMWKLFFGQGLSKSLDDLGSQGEWPTHPELLDYLAVEFRSQGWDVKRLVRLLVLSGTYRQDSKPSREAKAADPFNRLLSSQSRFRLDAEFVRDNALFVAGLLSTRIGGESVKPYQPDGYWDYLNFPRRTYVADTGEKQYRRGLYTHWQRSFLHPSLLAFDATSREECTAERPRSNTPQQALVLLNDPTYVEAARTFAASILRDGGDSIDARLKFAYRKALSREPRGEELVILRSFVASQRAQYTKDPQAAAALIRTGQAPVPAAIDAVELAAWTATARTIMNLHEFVVRM